ncbi:PAS domain-containing protein [Pedobacter mendelii]|uniref:histidine kinase n=1 Tax=Pedobacter mendelii TaxID=1908240 RepID=A0ABQ2BI31_9SPHI|nr:PAS domain-containing protein [Pedobacter mendelii]GGI24871.1 hypothetical protein GCM10008119_14820 [Pedobacter mendelii]
MNYLEDTKKLLDKSNYFYIITAGMDGNYSYVNKHYANQFAYIHRELQGQPYHITMHEDDRDICREVSEKCFANPGLLFPATIRKHDGKGGYIYTQWEYCAILDEENNPVGIFCLGYNITEFIGDKIRLNGAMDQIQEKSNLLNKVAFQQSHLIRAPLTNILALAAILEKQTNNKKLLSICNMILESALNLDQVIRDIVGDINHQKQ